MKLRHARDMCQDEDSPWLVPRSHMPIVLTHSYNDLFALCPTGEIG